ncbi:MAG TPA: hypothetical protein VGK73_25960 [Polyangiaceae bacterium]
MRDCTREEFRAFVSAHPALDRLGNTICDPPMAHYQDPFGTVAAWVGYDREGSQVAWQIDDDYRPKPYTVAMFERATRELTHRVVELTERLLAAYARDHDRMCLTTRKDERGRQCQFPLGEGWGNPVTEAIREQSRAHADAYFAACDIPPADCMVVWWIDGITARVAYERKPDGW